MRTSEEMDYEDERDWHAQQRYDDEMREWRLTNILRRLAWGETVSLDNVLELCAGCGIDKRNVLWKEP